MPTACRPPVYQVFRPTSHPAIPKTFQWNLDVHKHEALILIVHIKFIFLFITANLRFIYSMMERKPLPLYYSHLLNTLKTLEWEAMVCVSVHKLVLKRTCIFIHIITTCLICCQNLYYRTIWYLENILYFWKPTKQNGSIAYLRIGPAVNLCTDTF